jgi:hypothetical protein
MDSTTELRRLVDRFGHHKVWSVGLKVLGFPPTWEPSLVEVLSLSKELQRLEDVRI